MKIPSIQLKNIKCFRGEHLINLSPSVNVFVGYNNSGKSTILKSIYQIQDFSLNEQDRSAKSYDSSFVRIYLDKVDNTFHFNGQKVEYEMYDEDGENAIYYNPDRAWFFCLVDGGKARLEGEFISDPVPLTPEDYHYEIEYDAIRLFNIKKPYTNVEPNNVIYPFLSNRKVTSFSTSVKIEESNKITGDLSNICAKIDKIISSNRPSRNEFEAACKDILGFNVGTIQTNEGKAINLIIDDHEGIDISELGAGIPNLLGMIVDLCVARDKMFIIEEPENDIHPKALKALLDLIQKRSKENQFFISTHSNIVVKYLGLDQDNKIFQVVSDTDYDQYPVVPTSQVVEVSNNPSDRIKLLEDLGYDSFDYSLWSGWLFLEEYSAETIIKEFLIPQFAPKLEGKLRTNFTSGSGNMKRRFNSFNDLFVFVHLTDALYKNKAWVLIDAGKDEKDIVDQLRDYYSKQGWKDDRFRQLTKHNFEEYYPAQYSNKFAVIMQNASAEPNQDRKEFIKRDGKKALLSEVREWYKTSLDQAKTAFAESAEEVINVLKEIELQLT